MTAECWLARYGVHERGPMPPCDGRLIRAHLLPRQLLLRTLNPVEAVAAIDDPRSWVYACGGITGSSGHHGALDVARTIRVPYEHLPVGLLELADECGLGYWLEREYKREQRRAA
jgi:hypothetical protein